MERSRKGFTLVELLVVIAIIGILIALLLPAVRGGRNSAQSAACRNKLRQIGIAARNFHQQHQYLPTYWGQFPPEGEVRVHGSWFVHLLPFLEQEAVYDQVLAARPSRCGGKWVVVSPASSDFVGGHWDTTGCERISTDTDHVGHTFNLHEWRPPPVWVPRQGTPPEKEYIGFHYEIRSYNLKHVTKSTFDVLQCPGDPSEIGPSETIEFRRRRYGLTSFQANIHALGVPCGKNLTGIYHHKPTREVFIRDGLSTRS